VKDFENEDVVVREVNKLAERFSNRKIILLGCSDTLLKVIMKNKSNFKANVIAPYIDIDQAEQLMNKEEFYKLADKHGIPYPKSFIHEKSLGQSYELGFDFPVVLKPADQPLFFSKKFSGQKKVYIIKDREELGLELARIYDSGYDATMIIQEYVPGDDSYMYVLNSYSDQNGKVTFMSLAHILLEEHTPTARGNHAVIVNDYNDTLFKLAKKFLEEINFKGFSNFDIKYDVRDNTYKFFEMNVRQGNSHYHVTAAGYNVTEFLVDDRVYNKERKLILAENKKLFMIVPKMAALAYVTRDVCRKEMLALMLKGETVNPLFYSKDMSFKRFLYLMLNNFGHYIKFWKYYSKID
jgi:D-aspartate ligase